MDVYEFTTPSSPRFFKYKRVGRKFHKFVDLDMAYKDYYNKQYRWYGINAPFLPKNQIIGRIRKEWETLQMKSRLGPDMPVHNKKSPVKKPLKKPLLKTDPVKVDPVAKKKKRISFRSQPEIRFMSQGSDSSATISYTDELEIGRDDNTSPLIDDYNPNHYFSESADNIQFDVDDDNEDAVDDFKTLGNLGSTTISEINLEACIEEPFVNDSNIQWQPVINLKKCNFDSDLLEKDNADNNSIDLASDVGEDDHIIDSNLDMGFLVGDVYLSNSHSPIQTGHASDKKQKSSYPTTTTIIPATPETDPEDTDTDIEVIPETQSSLIFKRSLNAKSQSPFMARSRSSYTSESSCDENTPPKTGGKFRGVFPSSSSSSIRSLSKNRQDDNWSRKSHEAEMVKKKLNFDENNEDTESDSSNHYMSDNDEDFILKTPLTIEHRTPANRSTRRRLNSRSIINIRDYLSEDSD